MKKNYSIIPVKKVLPLEYVFPRHLENLRKMIYRDGYMKYALEVERGHNITLDGSHRLALLLLDGFVYAPVHWVDYDDPNVRVGTHRMHRLLVNGPTNISKEEVIRRGLTGDLFPPRTTRHFFPFLREEINIPLEKLRPTHGKRPNYSYLVKKVPISEEIEHNRKYIREISEEEIEIKNYLEEGKRTKKYLLKQIKEMENETKK